jgi:hypothetical protein
MSFIKSLVCAVLFVVHATNAEFFVNCMASPQARPEMEPEKCMKIKEKVLEVLGACSGSPLRYVGSQTLPTNRFLRSREEQELQTPRWAEEDEEHPTQRKLTDCFSTNLNSSQQAVCCMQSGGYYSYCGSPTGDERRLQDGSDLMTAADMDVNDLVPLRQKALERIATACTKRFRKLATNFPECLGTDPDELFCKTFVIVASA